MDESDNLMHADQLSQAGSVALSPDKMEFEQEDDGTIVRDMEMEVHDLEAEGTIADMKAAIVADDAEMNAEMIEQEDHSSIQEQADWKDAEIEIETLNTAGTDESAISLAELDAVPSETFSRNPDASITPNQENGSSINESAALTGPVTNGQLTLEESIPTRTPDKADLQTETELHANEVVPQSDLKPDENESHGTKFESETAESSSGRDEDAHGDGQVGQDAAQDDEGEKTPVQATREGDDEAARGIAEQQYDDADEVTAAPQKDTGHGTTSTPPTIPAPEFYDDSVVHALGVSHRPALQKDFLAHVEVFADVPPPLRSAEYGQAAPHVLLTYKNEIYSLFRPSSVPSGDDENLLFSEDEEQRLYYSPLETLIERLHAAFPNFRVEGDEELILDLSLLDMQISEDNIYCQQLSLHDFDRIRVGMCQPELDRLTISILTGKRLPYKFNELAEHVYRMYAGSEYDESGLGYDETGEEQVVDPADHVPGHYSEAAATEEAVQSAQDERNTVLTAELEATEPQQGNTASESNLQDSGRKAEDGAKQNEGPEEEEAPEYEEEPLEGEEAEAEEGAEEIAYEEDDGDGTELHPPSDEHYEDPEFSQQVAGGEEAEEDGNEHELYNEGDEAEEPLDYEDDDSTDQPGALEAFKEELRATKHDFNGQTLEKEVEEAEAEFRIDPDAPLDEVADQLEDFEEGTLEREEDVAADAIADRGVAPTDTDTGVNVEAVDKDTERIYAGMDSLSAEEDVRVRGDVHALVEDYSVGAAGAKSTTNGSAKRHRDGDEGLNGIAEGHDGEETALSDGSDHVKRPRVSSEV